MKSRKKRTTAPRISSHSLITRLFYQCSVCALQIDIIFFSDGVIVLAGVSFGDQKYPAPSPSSESVIASLLFLGMSSSISMWPTSVSFASKITSMSDDLVGQYWVLTWWARNKKDIQTVPLCPIYFARYLAHYASLSTTLTRSTWRHCASLSPPLRRRAPCLSATASFFINLCICFIHRLLSYAYTNSRRYHQLYPVCRAAHRDYPVTSIPIFNRYKYNTGCARASLYHIKRASYSKNEGICGWRN